MAIIHLDLQFFAGEKTEKATPKKRDDARKKGQVLKSQDVTSAIVLFSLFLFLFFAAKFMRDGLSAFFIESFTHYTLMDSFTIDMVMAVFMEILMEMSIILLPVMGIAVLAE